MRPAGRGLDSTGVGHNFLPIFHWAIYTLNKTYLAIYHWTTRRGGVSAEGRGIKLMEGEEGKGKRIGWGEVERKQEPKRKKEVEREDGGT